MSDFTDAYVNLLIKQYWELTNARAEVESIASSWEPIYQLFDAFLDAFDIDQAIGRQLDIIGKIVGINRVIPFVLEKIAFGFDENPNARTFDSKFEPISGSAPFLDKFEPTRTPLELNDYDYRIFIKAKIAQNIGSAFLTSDTKATIQQTLNVIFSGNAYAVDNKDMSMVLYVSPEFDSDRLTAILQLNLLPKPQGVQYFIVIQAAPGETFGFSDNPNSLGFADKFDALQVGGRLANKVILS